MADKSSSSSEINLDINKRIESCLQQQQFAQALELCDQALTEQPSSPNILAVKGLCLYQLKRYGTAVECIKQAVRQAPHVDKIVNLAIYIFMERYFFEAVVEVLPACTRHHSNNPKVWHALGIAYFYLGNSSLAIESYQRVLQLQPSDTINYALGLAQLYDGQYQQGFAKLENRFVVKPSRDWFHSEQHSLPKWKGETLHGKSLLLWTEQGYGDVIQFSRVITWCAKQVDKIDLVLSPSHSSLEPLLSTLDGVSTLYMAENRKTFPFEQYDYHLPLMSLMAHVPLETAITSSNIPYLYAEPDNKWEALIHNQVNQDNLKIGLVWKSHGAARIDGEGKEYNEANNKNNNKEGRQFVYYEKIKKSLTLSQLSPLFVLPSTQFYSLQLNPSSEEQQLLSSHNIIDVSEYLHSFSDTAKAIAQLDIVISIDTSVVHLAGAMGKITINLLPCVADWRWHDTDFTHTGTETPWYPSMRLLRQAGYGDWENVVSKLVAYLSQAIGEYKETGEIVLF